MVNLVQLLFYFCLKKLLSDGGGHFSGLGGAHGSCLVTLLSPLEKNGGGGGGGGLRCLSGTSFSSTLVSS